MSHLQVTLSADPAAFRPGEAVSGEASWELDEALSVLELKLCWTTDGSFGVGGDPVVVHRESLTVNEPHEHRAFRFELPQGPWSFQGKLFSVRWFVELAIDDYRYQRADFVLGPAGKAIEVPTENPR